MVSLPDLNVEGKSANDSLVAKKPSCLKVKNNLDSLTNARVSVFNLAASVANPVEEVAFNED